MSDTENEQNGGYRHIAVGRYESAGGHSESASIRDRYGDSIVEILVEDAGVKIVNSCDCYYRVAMPKSEAIAALKELIHYIEINTYE